MGGVDEAVHRGGGGGRGAAALSGREIDVVHLVGGGSKNALLCRLTAAAAGRRQPYALKGSAHARIRPVGCPDDPA